MWFKFLFLLLQYMISLICVKKLQHSHKTWPSHTKNQSIYFDLTISLKYVSYIQCEVPFSPVCGQLISECNISTAVLWRLECLPYSLIYCWEQVWWLCFFYCWKMNNTINMISTLNCLVKTSRIILICITFVSNIWSSNAPFYQRSYPKIRKSLWRYFNFNSSFNHMYTCSLNILTFKMIYFNLLCVNIYVMCDQCRLKTSYPPFDFKLVKLWPISVLTCTFLKNNCIYQD